MKRTKKSKNIANIKCEWKQKYFKLSACINKKLKKLMSLTEKGKSLTEHGMSFKIMNLILQSSID